MEDAARTMARPHAVEDLVNLIESLVRP